MGPRLGGARLKRGFILCSSRRPTLGGKVCPPWESTGQVPGPLGSRLPWTRQPEPGPQESSLARPPPPQEGASLGSPAGFPGDPRLPGTWACRGTPSLWGPPGTATPRASLHAPTALGAQWRHLRLAFRALHVPASRDLPVSPLGPGPGTTLPLGPFLSRTQVPWREGSWHVASGARAHDGRPMAPQFPHLRNGTASPMWQDSFRICRDGRPGWR